MLIAQISDLHIRRPGQLAYRQVDTAPYLQRCIAALNARMPRPDAVLISGDLVDTGHPDEYAHLHSLLAALQVPYYLMAGNHDRREPLRAAFREAGYLFDNPAGFIQYRVDLGTREAPLRLLALDSQDPPHSGGRLCEARLAWLAAELELARGLPVLVALHHPPFVTGIEHMDQIALAPGDAQALAQLIAAYPNVERVLCGHVHRPIHVRFAGTIASACPSPAHQVVLDLRVQGPAAFTMEPPAYALHRWDPHGGMVSHHAYVDAYPGPYPFHETHGALIE
jgi:3',5'-cyclic AMP phosphodiesterase CpdA